MSTLQELLEMNKMDKLNHTLVLQETLLKEVMATEVQINENETTMLNRIFDDIFARLDDAKADMGEANRAKGEDKRSKMSSAMSNMNKINNIISMLIKQYYPKDGQAPNIPAEKLAHYVTPMQAAQAMGIHPSKLQNYTASGQLKMYNNNGEWALKGEDVQRLIDSGKIR